VLDLVLFVPFVFLYGYSFSRSFFTGCGDKLTARNSDFSLGFNSGGNGERRKPNHAGSAEDWLVSPQGQTWNK
jgi:hypothetical protein